MTSKVLVVILLSVALSAFAQIALKTGMGNERVQQELGKDSSKVRMAIAVARSPYVWIGLALYGLGAIIWLGALARVDVSMAYPFVGLGFILTMFLGAVVLGESITPLRILGTVLVTAGVVLVGRS